MKIKDLRTDKKYTVTVDTSNWDIFKKEFAILSAIDCVADEIIPKGKVSPFIRKAGRIFKDARDYDQFVSDLESKMKLKIKIK